MGRQRISEARLLEKLEAVLGYQEHGAGKREEDRAFSSWLWHTLRGSIPTVEMAGRSSWICSLSLVPGPQDWWESFPCFTQKY